MLQARVRLQSNHSTKCQKAKHKLALLNRDFLSVLFFAFKFILIRSLEVAIAPCYEQVLDVVVIKDQAHGGLLWTSPATFGARYRSPWRQERVGNPAFLKKKEKIFKVWCKYANCKFVQSEKNPLLHAGACNEAIVVWQNVKFATRT